VSDEETGMSAMAAASVSETAAQAAGHRSRVDAVTAWFGRAVRTVIPLGFQGVYGTKDFRAILHRERALAYRHGRYFSLLELNMTNGNRNPEAMKSLANALSERVRNTDVVGLTSTYGMAAILPETSRDGAERVGREICDQVARRFTRPEYAVEVFPHAAVAGGTGRADDGAQDAAVEEGDTGHRVSRVARLGMPIWKRVLDIAISLFAITLAGPLMLAVAVLIRRVSPGPVLFRQERIGFLGRRFTLYKFRTMHAEADPDVHRRHLADLVKSNEPMRKLDRDDDARLIPFGRWIRAAAIDELPQFLNVLKGDMSLVGPRPPIAYEFDEYELWHKRRCDTVPGLTGVWQVSDRHKVSFAEMVRLDIGYAEGRSLWRDVKTLVKTVPVVLADLKTTAETAKGELG